MRRCSYRVWRLPWAGPTPGRLLRGTPYPPLPTPARAVAHGPAGDHRRGGGGGALRGRFPEARGGGSAVGPRGQGSPTAVVDETFGVIPTTLRHSGYRPLPPPGTPPSQVRMQMQVHPVRGAGAGWCQG